MNQAPLTAERLAELRKASDGSAGMEELAAFGEGPTLEEYRSLLAMAERSVSEETVRQLARTLTPGDKDFDGALRFALMCRDDLRSAAQALRDEKDRP